MSLVLSANNGRVKENVNKPRCLIDSKGLDCLEEKHSLQLQKNSNVDRKHEHCFSRVIHRQIFSLLMLLLLLLLL